MTRGIATATLKLAACAEIAEQLTPEIGNSLRWLATHPGSGATLVIEGFVRGGELVLVADIPGKPALRGNGNARPKPARKDSSSPRPSFRMSTHRGLLNFALSLTPDGRKS